MLTLPVIVLACLQMAVLRPAQAAAPPDTPSRAAGYPSSALNPVEERGRRIWYEACGDNGRFHAYILPQKLGIPSDWYKVLGSKHRDERWKRWGLIPDPDCQPADDKSFGFDVCKGDRGDDGGVAPAHQGYSGLLDFVGKPGYKDPGCWISGGFVAGDCYLGLGTSTGALGYRKFPNPRFDPKRWRGWEAFDPHDGSVEPPFLIGTACGSCHIAFDPLNPPKDPNHPLKENLHGLVGNQFQHMEDVVASGLDHQSLEWQAFITARAGAVETSGHPNDLVHNPGTVNSIINLAKRPPGLPPHKSEAFKSFDKQIAGENGKIKTERVFNILKGGEDDVGGAGAILRVYVNEGLCSETCWMNHLLDLRSIVGRGSQQTPFSQAQCRRDCPYYGALERHYDDVMKFFLSPAGRPTDLKDALFPAAPADERYKKLVAHLGPAKVNQGRRLFAANCAQCHSSLKPPAGQRAQDFFDSLAVTAERTGVDAFTAETAGVREDWLGNEERESAAKIGTFRCRALHSNHMRGHVWDEFSSETYKNSPTPAGIPELRGTSGGGRGYYRNISLLSVWTQAPFMHNNAIGPELCNFNRGHTTNCVDKDQVLLPDGRKVSLTSVEGRLKIFDDSMHDLLNPDLRPHKITRTDDDLRLPVFGEHEVVIPKGTPVALLASLDYRRLAAGLAKQVQDLPATKRPGALVDAINTIFKDPAKVAEVLASGPPGGDPKVYNGYSNCTDVIEDKGHEFGVQLTAEEKAALTAFMKTL